MGKIYLILLILSVVLAVGMGSSGDDNTNKSSGLHVRKKRLVDRSDDLPACPLIEDFGYSVKLHEYTKHICTAVILLANVVLTTAMCVLNHENTHRYSVYSGTADLEGGTPHTVIKIRHHPEFIQSDMRSGNLALVQIDPVIDIVHSVNRKISIYTGSSSPNTALVNTVVHTCGWGKVFSEFGLYQREYPDELRSITVPMISTEQCRREHGGENIVPINDKVICTFDVHRQKHASMNDYGNPLVYIDRHRRELLLGILFWTRDDGHPDVYVNLHHAEYKAWIVSKLVQIATNPLLF